MRLVERADRDTGVFRCPHARSIAAGGAGGLYRLVPVLYDVGDEGEVPGDLVGPELRSGGSATVRRCPAAVASNRRRQTACCPRSIWILAGGVSGRRHCGL